MQTNNKTLKIIKIGGSCITRKNQNRTLHSENIGKLSHLFAQMHKQQDCHLIIIHGAGSFGHFEAKEYQLGATMQPSILGMSKCRSAVQFLHAHLLQAFVNDGQVPIVGISPHDLFFKNSTGELQCSNAELIQHYVCSMNIVPMLHGDVIRDTQCTCSILSGDTIMTWLCALEWPMFAHVQPIFITDVDGVYTEWPPLHGEFDLIRQIHVHKESMQVQHFDMWQCANETSATTIQMTQAEHDVTGGLQAKIEACTKVLQVQSKVHGVYILPCGHKETEALLVHDKELTSVGTCVKRLIK